jgi:hypothetical protein
VIYVAKLRNDLMERRQALHVEKMRLEILMRELDQIEVVLAVLPEEQISQLQLRDNDRKEGGPKDPDSSVVDLDAHRQRKTPVRLRLEPVRDWILDTVGEREFSVRETAEHFNVSYNTAKTRLHTLYSNRVLVYCGGGKYRYNTDMPAAPRTRPRGERLLGVPAPRSGGTAVPGTGVPRGPAGTPGALRRQQGAAARVKMPKRTGVRL